VFDYSSLHHLFLIGRKTLQLLPTSLPCLRSTIPQSWLALSSSFEGSESRFGQVELHGEVFEFCTKPPSSVHLRGCVFSHTGVEKKTQGGANSLGGLQRTIAASRDSSRRSAGGNAGSGSGRSSRRFVLLRVRRHVPAGANSKNSGSNTRKSERRCQSAGPRTKLFYEAHERLRHLLSIFSHTSVSK
jgi:hypothetical protein